MIQDELDAVAALAHRLFQALTLADVTSIRRCYTADATYSDPVLGELGEGSARCVWPFIFAHVRRPDWRFTIEDVDLNSASIRTHLDFVFSATNRPVSLEIRSLVVARGSLVARHDDDFDVSSWLEAFPVNQRLGLWIPGRRFSQARQAWNDFAKMERGQ